MTNYITGCRVYGYNTVDITDDNLNSKDNNIVVVLSEGDNHKLSDYYKVVSKAIRNGSNITLINVNAEDSMFKPLAALLAAYRCYNIYQVDNINDVTAPYLKLLSEREPDYCEVQSYIGGDITAYGQITELIYGIENLVQDGNIDELSDFISKHSTTIENFSVTIDYMKSICEAFHIQEITEKVDKLEEKVTKYKNDYDNARKQLGELQSTKESTEQEIAKLKERVRELIHQNEALKDAADTGTVIQHFEPCNTAQINCKAKQIVYFKEISQITYINSFVDKLVQLWQSAGHKVKMLIYDNKTEFYESYSGLTVVNGKLYQSTKSTLLRQTERFVVSEPVQMIINDVLTYEPGYDIVVVYDRTKSKKDIVVGNNVSKFYVVNSNNDYVKVGAQLGITETKRIITRPFSDIADDVLDIPTIENYSSSSDSAKTMKYSKAITSKKKNLFISVTQLARIRPK